MDFKHEKSILLVDDDEQIVKIIQQLLKEDTIELIIADSVEDALIFLENIDIDLIIVDYLLTNGFGFEIIKQAKQDKPNIPTIMISGEGKNIRSDSYDIGVNMYLEKPFNGKELRQIIINLLSLFEAQEKLNSANSVISALIKTIESRDKYTEGHSRRVASGSLDLYDELGYKDNTERENLFMGCLLHDIGKIGVPDSILNANRPLNTEEYDIIKQHPQIGYDICKDIKEIEGVLQIVKSHHEKLNGSGYPDGLKEDSISNITQIVTIIDIYDALIYDRPYRKGMDVKDVFRILDAMALSGEINKQYLKVLKELYK